ncbi:hypothetical protein NMY22_g8985 [Coprinellus aureogranulatus]|nr:hypothetical protein NMY22_g8985 [Coprinellus aureogranulatus]
MLDFLCKFLSTSAQPALEAIELNFAWVATDLGGAIHPVVDLMPLGGGWERVDGLLADRSRFPKLHALQVSVRVSDPQGQPHLSTDNTELGCPLREGVIAALRKTKERGLLIAVGEKNTETMREFETIVNAKAGQAWSFT